MAEIGLIASIIGIVSAGTKVALVLSQLGNDIGSAGKEARLLAAEIRGSCAVLTTLQGTLKQVQTSKYYAHCADVTNNMTDTSLEIFAEILDVVENLRSFTEMPDSMLKIRRRLQWAFQKPKILMLRAALDAYRSNLALMLGTLDIAEKMSRNISQDITKDVIEEEQQDFTHLDYLRKAHRSSVIRIQEIEHETVQNEEDLVSQDQNLTMESPLSSPELQDEESFLPQAGTYVRELREEIDLIRSSRSSFQSSGSDSIFDRVSQYSVRLSQLLEKDQDRISGRWLRTLSLIHTFQPGDMPSTTITPGTYQAPRESLMSDRANKPGFYDDSLEKFVQWMRDVDVGTQTAAMTRLIVLFGTSDTTDKELEMTKAMGQQLQAESHSLKLKIAWLERQLMDWQQGLPNSTKTADVFPMDNRESIEKNPISPVFLSASARGDSSASGKAFSDNTRKPTLGSISPFIRSPGYKLSTLKDASGYLSPHNPSSGKTSPSDKRRSGLWSPVSNADGGVELTPGSPSFALSPQLAPSPGDMPREVYLPNQTEKGLQALEMKSGYNPSQNFGPGGKEGGVVDSMSTSAPAPTPERKPEPAPSRPTRPQVEIFKSFRVSIDDPTHKVLPVALENYNINVDWRQYALYIVHGNEERCLGLDEKPLILFRQLDREGKKPMFMLRKHAPPIEGFVNTKQPQDLSAAP
jgi:hypothetical protein